jgi:hypothetical protein
MVTSCIKKTAFGEGKARLFNRAQHHEDVKGSENVAPHILDFRTRLR